jgi:hypothetical protein
VLKVGAFCRTSIDHSDMAEEKLTGRALFEKAHAASIPAFDKWLRETIDECETEIIKALAEGMNRVRYRHLFSGYRGAMKKVEAFDRHFTDLGYSIDIIKPMNKADDGTWSIEIEVSWW